jgi:hypothetical protein
MYMVPKRYIIYGVGEFADGSPSMTDELTSQDLDNIRSWDVRVIDLQLGYVTEHACSHDMCWVPVPGWRQ